MLQDNSFRFLSKASQDRQYLEASPKFVAFTCGLVRGSLANLGKMLKIFVIFEYLLYPRALRRSEHGGDGGGDQHARLQVPGPGAEGVVSFERTGRTFGS